MPGLDFGTSEIYLVSRNSLDSKNLFEGSHTESLVIKDFNESGVLQTLKTFLKLNPADKLLIINFIGNFGTIDSLDNLNLENFESEVNDNLIPFMILSKLITSCESGLFLTFAGAGVGGDNLEVASLSYLASKASIVFLVEGIDNILRGNGIRVSAISPGPFPSRMQKVVAESQDTLSVSAERKSQALKTLHSQVNPSKLISMLNFLMENPDIAGGRIWSASFDSLVTELGKENFGKMRRTF
jgi:short-subunit dehydrogenase